MFEMSGFVGVISCGFVVSVRSRISVTTNSHEDTRTKQNTKQERPRECQSFRQIETGVCLAQWISWNIANSATNLLTSLRSRKAGAEGSNGLSSARCCS